MRPWIGAHRRAAGVERGTRNLVRNARAGRWVGWGGVGGGRCDSHARMHAHMDTHAHGRPMPSFIHKSTSVSIYSHGGQIAIVAHACVHACVRACVRACVVVSLNGAEPFQKS